MLPSAICRISYRTTWSLQSFLWITSMKYNLCYYNSTLYSVVLAYFSMQYTKQVIHIMGVKNTSKLLLVWKFEIVLAVHTPTLGIKLKIKEN